MEKGQFQLTKLQVSEFYLGWNQLAGSPLSPLHPKYEKLKSDLALFNSKSEKRIKKQNNQSEMIMQQLAESQEQVRCRLFSDQFKLRNAIRQTKCSRLLNTMSEIRQTLDSLKHDNQSIETLTAFVKRKMPQERTPSPGGRFPTTGTNLRGTARSQLKLPEIKQTGGQKKKQLAKGRNSSLEYVKSDKTRPHRALQLTQESKKSRKMLSSQRSQRRSPGYHGSRRTSQARKKEEGEEKKEEQEETIDLRRTGYKLPYLSSMKGKERRMSVGKTGKQMKLKIKSHMLQPVAR